MRTRIMTLLRTNFIMLTRQRELILTSLGLAIVSMLVFGFLFSSNSASKTRLGVVDQDHTPVSAQLVSQLQKSDALQVFSGSSDEEQQALRDGQRDAVVVMPAGFSQQLVQGGARLQVYYDQSNPVTATSAQLTVKAIVDGINSKIMHQPGPVIVDQQAVAAKNLREIDFITPGMLGMLLMWANLAVGIQLVNWRETGITRRLAATPLKPISMISAQVVARLALSLLQGALLLALAIWLFNVHIYGNIGLLALVVTVGALTLLAIGFAIASFVKKSEAANSILLLISFPMMFLGGSYFDVNSAPSFIQPLVHAMPLYYLNEALRQVIYNGAGWSAIQTGMLVMIAWMVASMLVVWRAFKWL
ncbi:MAG TPA: ABC transporter permease [Ktedonobacteraceae bacterium]|nr:ABC transporter permease [Ktedonobacteraceae bacterium]